MRALTYRSALSLSVLLMCACSSSQTADPEPRFTPGVGTVLSERRVVDERGPHRRLTIGDTTDDASLLRALEADALADGWTTTRCLTAAERCFRRRGLFLAMVGRAAIEADPSLDPTLAGYTSSPPAERQQPGEVFVIVAVGPAEPTSATG